jgi:hypothetical protein
VPPPSGPVAPVSGPATGVLVDAEEKYKAEDYQGAAVIFNAVATGKTPGDTYRAQFWLGKSLYKLEFYAVSLSTFNEIVAAGPSHPYHKLTLPWLASLSRELPEGAGVLEKVGTYKPADLEDSAFDEVRDELYYLLGRFYYQKGDLGQGIALLGQVPDNSDYYIPAQFFLGVAETREFHGPQAVEAFKNVLRKNITLREAGRQEQEEAKKEAKKKKKAAQEVSDQGRQGPGRRRDRGAQLRGGDAALRGARQPRRSATSSTRSASSRPANKYFDKIPLESPYWLDSILAASWSEFRLVELEPEKANLHYQRTLGYIHTLNAPFFYDYLYPESVILKAVTYYFNCRYQPAKLAIEEFNRRYPKTRDDLKDLLAKAPEDFALFDLSVKIRNSESKLDPFVEEVAQKSLQDKTLEKNYAYVNELQRESAQLDEMKPDFKSSPLSDTITENLDGLLSSPRRAPARWLASA